MKSSKIHLKDVSWWMSIKDACKLGVPIIAKLSKEGCNSLAIEEGHFALHVKMNEAGVDPAQFEKHTPPKWVY
jgi:hypothetical protein